MVVSFRIPLAPRLDQTLLQPRPLLLLLPRRRVDIRRRIANFDRSPFLRHVVEERKQAVKVALRKWIVLVVVAARAAESQAKPDGSRRFDAIGHVFDGILLGNNAPFGVAAMVAVEAGGDPLGQRRLRQ